MPQQERTGFGAYIAKERKHLRMTQATLASRIGVSKSAIAKWETNGGLPDRDNMKKLAEAMGLSVDELHKAIEKAGGRASLEKVDITAGVIATLESYGYTVIGPGGQKEGGHDL